MKLLSEGAVLLLNLSVTVRSILQDFGPPMAGFCWLHQVDPSPQDGWPVYPKTWSTRPRWGRSKALSLTSLAEDDSLHTKRAVLWREISINSTPWKHAVGGCRGSVWGVMFTLWERYWLLEAPYNYRWFKWLEGVVLWTTRYISSSPPGISHFLLSVHVFYVLWQCQSFFTPHIYSPLWRRRRCLRAMEAVEIIA